MVLQIIGVGARILPGGAPALLHQRRWCGAKLDATHVGPAGEHPHVLCERALEDARAQAPGDLLLHRFERHPLSGARRSTETM